MRKYLLALGCYIVLCSQTICAQEYIKGNTYYDNNGKAYYYDENGKAFYYPEPVEIENITDNLTNDNNSDVADKESDKAVLINYKPMYDSDKFSSAEWWKTATLEDVKAELMAGANVNATSEDITNDGKTTLYNVTPLMKAFIYGKPDLAMVKLFIAAKIDVNAKNNNGKTTLMYAAGNNENPEVIKALIDAGADVNYSMTGGQAPGWTALMAAVRWNPNFEIAKVLIDAGADVNAKTKDGGTVLERASLGSAGSEVIKILLQAGADVNAKNNAGWTALMSAARDNTNPEVVKALINAGADIGAYVEHPITTAAYVAMLSNSNHQIFAELVKPEIDSFCRLNNNYSDDVYYCKDRLTLYFQKEHQLPNCTNNMTAMLGLTPFLQASPDTAPGKGAYALVVMGNMMSNFNCSLSNTFKTFASEGNK